MLSHEGREGIVLLPPVFWSCLILNKYVQLPRLDFLSRVMVAQVSIITRTLRKRYIGYLEDHVPSIL